METDLNNYVMFFVSLLTSLSIASKRNLLLSYSIDKGLSFALLMYFVLFIGFYPIKYGSDKYVYKIIYENITSISSFSDIGWDKYNLLLNQLLFPVWSFFLLTAYIYLIGYKVFYLKYINKGGVYYLLLATFSSLGFVSYGINTLRAGMALSLFLLALSMKEKRFLYPILFVFSVLIHKSLLLLVGAYYVTSYYKKNQYYYFFWIACFFLSLLNISFISSFLENIFGFADERFSDYLSVTESEGYRVGFRIDFIIYSLIPIMAAIYYKNKYKYKDAFYDQLFNIYMLVNSFWLLIIRIQYTDRFAYLSWFLLPILMIYPLVNTKDMPYRNRNLSISIFLIAFISFYLNIRS
jgi:hypothetical protein